MKKNYNFERKKLVLPEYGRHIHQMIDYLSTVEDRAERNIQARAVIAVMGNLNPLLRDTADFTHKLWDHLFIMSDFKLDVDSPYPIPTAVTLAPVPNKLSYPTKRIKMKHYGKNIEKMLLAMQDAEDQEAVKETIGNIAKYMRTKSYEYNQEHPSNEVIIKDIKRLSNNMISIDEVALNNIKSEYKQPFISHSKNKLNKNKGKNNQSKTGKSNNNNRPQFRRNKPL